MVEMDALAAVNNDPDLLALCLVQQYLHEHGYTKALSALETEVGRLHDDTRLPRSSQLLDLVYRHVEELVAAEAPEEGSPEAMERAEDEAMLRGGKADFPQTIVHSIKGVHSTSIICVRLVPNREEVLTGSGDGLLRRLDFGGHVTWEAAVGSGGVLCMDIHPDAHYVVPSNSSGNSPSAARQPSELSSVEELRLSHLVAAGSMDGSLTVLHLATGAQLATTKCHAKYLVRCSWAGDGHHLATCSHDQTVQIHHVEVVSPVGGAGGLPTVALSQLRRIQYAASVQDVAFLADGTRLVVALRDTNYLRVLNLDSLDAPEVMVNLNAAGDDHVSFFARHLTPSPCGRFLLVSADTGRMLVLRVASWRLCRFVLYSLPTEQFHQFCAAWSRDSHYVMAGAAGGQVYVYHVGSGKVVAKIKLHAVNVRDLDYDPDRNVLATCSFDKVVQILKHQQQDGGLPAGGS